MDESTSKQCSKCNEVKPLDGFNVSRGNRDGRQGACRKCASRAAVENARKRRAARSLPDVLPVEKQCRRCAATRPGKDFYTNVLSSDGLSTWCRPCARESARESSRRRAENPVSPSTSPKACTNCETKKPASDFYPCPTTRDGLTHRCSECIRNTRRRWYYDNRERAAEYARVYNALYGEQRKAASRSWRQANPERRREYGRRYDAENAERVAEWKRAWYAANKERLRLRLISDPDLLDRRREQNRASAERTRDARAERQRRRRVDKLGLKIEDVDVDNLWTGDCGICGFEMDREVPHPDPFSKSIDHIIPLAHGGTHEANNLQWAHLFCNLSKGASMPD